MKRWSSICIALCMLAVLAAPAAGQWWTRPYDRWYYKDDWRAARVNTWERSFELEAPAESAWLIAQGNPVLDVLVDGEKRHVHYDSGIILHMDISEFVAGRESFTLGLGPRQIVAEGEIIDAEGNRYPFATGCDWPSPAPEGAELPPAPNAYRPPDGDSNPYSGSHNGLLPHFTAEQVAQSSISRSFARIQRLREQSIYLLRRYRHPSEVLSYDAQMLWRTAEAYAAPRIDQAERMLRPDVIAAMRQGELDEVTRIVDEAAELLNEAEAAVDAATTVERCRRGVVHYSALGEMLGDDAAEEVGDLLAEAAELCAAADAAAREGDWDAAGAGAMSAAGRVAQARALLAERAGHDLAGPDEFPLDALGWLNVPRLMGNDAERLPMDVLPPSANRIDLRGYWQFRIDPNNVGESEDWFAEDSWGRSWRAIYAPDDWEQQGVTDENENSPWDCPFDIFQRNRDGDRWMTKNHDNKPYNGYAWYRKTVFVPESWAELDRPIGLNIGGVSNWMQVWVNGEILDSTPSRGGRVYGVSNLRFGEENTIVIQVYNVNNFGGLLDGPLTLAVEDNQPEEVVTPMPAGFMREWTIDTSDGPARVNCYSPMMSPATLLSTDQPTMHLWGWTARGVDTPGLFYPVENEDGQYEYVSLGFGEVLAGERIHHGVLMLMASRAMTQPPVLGKPDTTLLVLEDRPESIRFGLNDLGQPELTLRFAEGGSTVMLMPQLSSSQPTGSDDWTTVPAVAVMASQLAEIDWANLRGRFTNHYTMMPIQPFNGGVQPLAPAPVLLSVALDAGREDVELGEVDSWYVGGDARLRTTPGDEITYETPIPDRNAMLRGGGELFGKQSAQDNMRKDQSESQMVLDYLDWGFDHNRYAFHWGVNWDIPLQEYMGGPISDDPAMWERMDELVDLHVDNGVHMMLCYFFNDDRPMADDGWLVRNSTRYWRRHPEIQENVFELWRRIAERYADYPADMVSYDFFNEPAYMHTDHWLEIMRELTAIIREVDDTHLIIWEAGDGWAQPHWFEWMEPVDDDNVMYSFHHYGKHWGYHEDEYYPSYSSNPEHEYEVLVEAILFGARHGARLHCGEFGISQIQPGGSAEAWLNDYLGTFERFGISWSWWNWSGLDIWRTGLRAGEQVNPLVETLEYWARMRYPTE